MTELAPGFGFSGVILGRSDGNTHAWFERFKGGEGALYEVNAGPKTLRA